MNKRTVGAISSSQYKQYERFDWKLENFFSLSKRFGDYYKSPSFDFSKLRWFLKLFVNGDKKEGWISLYLSITDVDAEKHIHYTLGVKTAKGNFEEWWHDCRTFDEEYSPTWGTSTAIKRTELVCRKSELAPSNILTITVIMSTFVPRIFRDTLEASIQTETKVVSEGSQTEKTGGEKALADIEKLLASGDKSDVTVQVDDVQFNVHGNILAARTPAISALFQHEESSNKISISDCEPDIFKEFLQYIYSGNIQDLTVQNVFALFRLADKYLANDLKFQCLTYIQDTLCVETFCDVVQLALSYGETELLQLAIDFASKNIRLIIRCVEWQKFNEKHPTEANEIVIKSLGPPEVSDLKKGNEDWSVQSDAEYNGAKVVNEGSQLSEKQGGEKALEDIGKLLVNGDNSDVVVGVGDIQFHAHKIILAARTPVLAAMFQHETAEKISNKISINDCEPDVFKEFLHYIYTGTVQHLTVQNVFSLHRVADKYLANDLKLKCLIYIQHTLCVETFCDSVQLALRYQESELLQLAIDFATKNIRWIIRSVEWQNFNQEHSMEANEILIKSLGPP